MSTFTFDDLISWSHKLPLWQRDALRRILSRKIMATDITELCTMAKSAQGLPTSAKVSPDPATRNHIRASGGSTSPVALTAVRDISYVNALAAGPITFAPEGLTVIYGDNASGKSGIARILKKAGRAREPGGQIRPSVFEPDPGKPASAVIEFRAGTADLSFPWVDGGPTTDELTRINVFDARCASVQVEEDNRLAYSPEILQVFQDLAETCRAVATTLKAEKERLEIQRPPHIGLLSLRPQTAAGILLRDLSPQTKTEDIDALCNLSDEERDRHKFLMRALQDSPASQADLLEARARRLNELDDLTAKLTSCLSEATLKSFEERVSDAEAAEEAAKAARQSFASNSSLVGLGTDAWKHLWESARLYSETVAYPSEPFPVTREEALCLLCQRPIDGITAQRLTKFEQFVQSDIQQRADTARGQIIAQETQLHHLKVPLSGTQLRESGLRDTPTAKAIKAFIVAARLRRRYLIRRASGARPSGPPNLPPRPDLGNTRNALREEIKSLRAAAQTDERRNMQREFEELDDRIKLSPLSNILKKEVARLLYCVLLELARSDCDTTGITRKGGEVAQHVVTARLRSDFAANLSQLGFTAPPVEIKLGLGTVGQHPYRISLIAKQNIPPSEILSEGEKTCVALAGFLAELETTNNGSGIIFDDPVSSLDHHYRLRVARLLIEVARQRQVVVFTHDIVFLLMLTKYARISDIPLAERSLRRGSPRHGIPEEGPPWVAMSIAKRLGVLRNELQAAAAILRRGDQATYEQKAEWIYKRLRQSWERAVEELLLNKVVVRFGDGVSTQRLKALTDITEADVKTVDSEMTYCSSFVHDESGAVNAGIPNPSVVDADIKRLDDWVAALRKRRQ